jgi:hypothetical protein
VGSFLALASPSRLPHAGTLRLRAAAPGAGHLHAGVWWWCSCQSPAAAARCPRLLATCTAMGRGTTTKHPSSQCTRAHLLKYTLPGESPPSRHRPPRSCQLRHAMQQQGLCTRGSLRPVPNGVGGCWRCVTERVCWSARRSLGQRRRFSAECDAAMSTSELPPTQILKAGRGSLPFQARPCGRRTHPPENHRSGVTDCGNASPLFQSTPR